MDKMWWLRVNWIFVSCCVVVEWPRMCIGSITRKAIAKGPLCLVFSKIFFNCCFVFNFF